MLLLRSKAVKLTDVVTRRSACSRLSSARIGRGDDKILRIARKVAKRQGHLCRGPEARHGHKTSAHGLTVTKVMSRSTPTQRSSPRRR